MCLVINIRMFCSSVREWSSDCLMLSVATSFVAIFPRDAAVGAVSEETSNLMEIALLAIS